MIAVQNARLAIEEFGEHIGVDRLQYRVTVMDNGSANPTIVAAEQMFDGCYLSSTEISILSLPDNALVWLRGARAWVIAPHCTGKALTQCIRELQGTPFEGL